MSKMGNLVMAIQEEVGNVMDPSFSFHPSELGMTRYEIAANELKRQGFYASPDMCEQVWDEYCKHEFCEL